MCYRSIGGIKKQNVVGKSKGIAPVPEMWLENGPDNFLLEVPRYGDLVIWKDEPIAAT